MLTDVSHSPGCFSSLNAFRLFLREISLTMTNSNTTWIRNTIISTKSHQICFGLLTHGAGKRSHAVDGDTCQDEDQPQNDQVTADIWKVIGQLKVSYMMANHWCAETAELSLSQNMRVWLSISISSCLLPSVFTIPSSELWQVEARCFCLHWSQHVFFGRS